MKKENQYGRLLSICAEDVPQFSNDINCLQPECGADAPAFLSADSSRLLSICAEDVPQFSNDVYNKRYTREKIANRFKQSGRNLQPECGADAPTFLSAVYNNSTQAKKRQADAPQYGRSMIEMLGVLSIIGVLSVGGFSMVKKMQNSYDTNKVMEEISSFVRKARTVMRQYDSTTDGSNVNDYICKGKAVPDGITAGTEELEGVTSCSSFEGTAGISYSFATASDNKALFAMTISNVPEEICMQIATADWGNSASSGFKGMKISSSSELKTSMSLGDAANACSDGVSIVMYYK